MSEKGVIIKIFLGFLATSEVKMYLSQSRTWKETSLEENRWKTVSFQEKDYIGYFIDSSLLSYSEIQEEERKAREQLHHYCPKLKVDVQPFQLFAQLFLS
jgi:hypothetical protein